MNMYTLSVDHGSFLYTYICIYVKKDRERERQSAREF